MKGAETIQSQSQECVLFVPVCQWEMAGRGERCNLETDFRQIQAKGQRSQQGAFFMGACDPFTFNRFPAGLSFPARASCGCGKWWSATQEADILCQLGHVDSVGGEVPEHLDKLIWESVEVDVELAVCERGNVSMRGHTIACTWIGLDNSLSTSFLVYVSSVLLSCTICTTCSRSSSPS